jgi:hypothetical protein
MPFRKIPSYTIISSLRLRELETEVDRLKHLVDELALDRRML